jgi:hypothetical protein
MAVRPDASKRQPQPGEGCDGEAIEPKKLPKSEEGEIEIPPRAAPAPGVPISAEEYERIKKAAESESASNFESAQEDSTG